MMNLSDKVKCTKISEKAAHGARIQRHLKIAIESGDLTKSF